MLETGTRGPYDPHGLRAPSLQLQFHCPLRGTSKPSFQHYNGRLVVHIAQLDFGCGFCWRICLSVMTVSLNEICEPHIQRLAHLTIGYE